MDLSLVLIAIIIVLFPLRTLGKVGAPGAAFPRTAETSSQTKQTLGEGEAKTGLQEQTSNDIAKKATNNFVASF